MARLSTRERAKLPDKAFAYIDGDGHRRLPIHDEAHVRDALGRFERVRFEDDAARERARRRLLNAAKRYGIVPVGFITGQLRSERNARGPDFSTFPTGTVTFLMTDIEGSTLLLRELGEDYAAVLKDVRAIIRTRSDAVAVARSTRTATSTSRCSSTPRRRSRPRWISSSRWPSARGRANVPSASARASIRAGPH